MEAKDKIYLDLDGALARMRGNTTLYRRLLGMFLHSEDFKALDSALSANDLPLAANIAHGIKGMTGNLSLTLLFDTTTRFMLELRENVFDKSTYEEYQQVLKDTVSVVLKTIAELE